MDSRRLVLLLIFMFSLVMLWDAWQKQNMPPPAPVAQGPDGSPSVAPTPTPSIPAAGQQAVPLPPAAAAAAAAPKVTVRTDLVVADVSAQGGDIVRLELTEHKATEDSEHNFLLLDSGERHIYVAQTGLIGEGLPNHKTMYALPEGKFELQPGQDMVQLRLAAPEANGVKVTKVLTFRRGSYLVDVGYEIANEGQAPLATHAYFQLTRDGKPTEGQSSMVQTFTGPALYTEQGKFEKIDFDDIASNSAKFVQKADNGWIGMVQHYFVSAWIPEGKSPREFFVRPVGDNLYSAGVILPTTAVAPGQSGKIEAKLYAGPQEQEKLEAVAPGFDLVVDYGWLTVIAAPLFWVLEWFYRLVGNWGWAIILLTILIKLIFFPLSAASYKSMAKMRLVTPRLTRLKEQYGDDKQKLNQAMMELYKSEKINPLGGCLPILVQIPVFIALYWVLLGSVEMRHAPWLGWIQDLSTKDPYFVLPIIMGVTMLVQTKLNPTPPDPIQAKVMLFMPIVFTGMFLFFPAGLVLYWTVNNLLSIAQQWQITRMIEGGKTKAA